MSSIVPFCPILEGTAWTDLGSGGGFSGSRLGRATHPDGREWAVKCHPRKAEPRLIEQTHRWMDQARECEFVPRVERTRDGRSLHVADGRLWEVQTWQPGLADFHATPSELKLQAAMQAVARVHRVWATNGITFGPCPAIGRRWAAIQEWETLVASGWRPRFEAGVAWHLLPQVIAPLKLALPRWFDRPVALQPTFGDLWHDHVLFTDDRVTGLIDYAAAKLDSPAADLARLLGSLIPHQDWSVALNAYEGPRPELELIQLIDRAGVVGAVIHWVRRFDEQPDMLRVPAAVARFTSLVERIAH